MTLLQSLLEVSGRAGKKLDQTVENGESLKAVLLRGWNLYHKDFNNRYLWPWRWKILPLQTSPNYADGTLTIAQGSRTVAGSGTAWTSALEGRFLKLTREDELYLVLSVQSATSLVLAKPYLGASGGSLPYLIWKKYYDLDPEVSFSKTLHVSRWPHEVDGIERKDMDGAFITGYSESAVPCAWALGEVNRKVVDYSTGTITIPLNSRTVTGVNTSFLDNAPAGSELIAGTSTYNVESADSDTQLTLIQRATTAIPPGTSFTLRVRNRTQMMLSSVPNPAINLYVRYPAIQFDLVNDSDETPVWAGFQHIVNDCLYGYLLEKFTSDDSYNWLKIYREETDKAWANIQEMNPVTHIVKPITVRQAGYRRSLYG